MLSTIVIFIAALHVAVTFPESLPSSVKLLVLATYGFLGATSFISVPVQNVKKTKLDLFRSMLLLKAIGCIIAFPYYYLEENAEKMSAAVREQLLISVISAALFVLGRVVLPKLRIFHSVRLGYAALFMVPGALLLARLTGPNTYGSYLSVGGILVFSICMVLMPPATAAAFSDMRTVNRLNPRLTALSGGELIFILTLGVIAVLSGKVNHEYGIVMIFVGCLGGLVFFMYGRSAGSKVIFSLTAVGLSLYVLQTSAKVMTRLSVILHLKEQWNRGHLSGEATPLYFFMLRVRGAGFYGYGNAMLSRKLYPTALNDYIFTTMIYNHGLILGILAFLLAISMCRQIMRTPAIGRFDTILVQSIGITMASIYITSFLGNIGSMPLTGISPVFLASAGRSMDAAGALMLGVAAGVEGRADARTRNGKKKRDLWQS